MKKTTIELPERLYRRAKVHAAQGGKTLKSLVVDALEAELARAAGRESSTVQSYWANRAFLPQFDRFRREGAYATGTDSTDALSADRDGR